MSIPRSFFSSIARRRFASQLRFCTIALLSLCGVAANAATIPVTTTADGIDAGSQTCVGLTVASLPGTNGVTSLREAICAANNNNGSDTITFAVNGVFALSGNRDDDSGLNGDLDVKDSTIIQGNGPANTIIDGSGNDRIFDVNPAAARSFELTNLTVRNGNVQNAALKNGGAMVLSNLVTSTITGCAITNNFAAANGAIDNRGNLTITSSVISGNQVAASNGNATGGGLHTTGTMQMNSCVIAGNTVRGEGGGFSWSVQAGVTVAIANSTISGNSATQPIGNGNGGGISATFGNQGAINLSNCTISGNHADNSGGGAYFQTPGGGTGTAMLTNVTITNNTADNDNNAAGAGGGFAVSNANVTLHNTIVAGNFNSLNTVRDDISGVVAGSSSYNLIGDSTGSSGLTNGLNNNQVGSAGSPIIPLLGSLADHGGATETHALLTGSPAIDKAHNVTAPATDQRGVARPQDGDAVAGAVADIGAYEKQVVLDNAYSAKNHNGTNFFVLLPLSGDAGIEPRAGGGTNDYLLVLGFTGSVNVSGSPQAQVIGGIGTVGSNGAGNGGSVFVSGNTVNIPLTNVASQQTIQVKLNGVNGQNLTIPMRVLVGDANADAFVNSGDATVTRNRSGQTPSVSNFRSDFNADGLINAGDATIVRSRSGHFVP